MVDRDDDVNLGIKTSALTFGRFDVAAVMLCYALFLALLAWLGFQRHAGVLYYAGLVAAALICVYHYRLIRDRNRLQCFRAFRHNNWIGLAASAGLAAASSRGLHVAPV